MMKRLIAVMMLVWGVAGTPQAVRAEPVPMLAAGVNHACAVTTAGGAVCWGGGRVRPIG